MSILECPTCGKTGFTSEGYMKRHHALSHGESLREEYECSIEDCGNRSYNPKFCGFDCLGKARRKYDKGVCKREGCKGEVYKWDYCSRDCANKESWKNRDNPAKRPEVRKKISESKKGLSHAPMPEEVKKKISEAMSGEGNPMHGLRGEDHPKHGMVSGLKLQTVEDTSHTVRSNWEKEIDLMLHRSRFEYEYEPETFELPEEVTYTPDFQVDDVIIEVKGWPDEFSKKRASLFMSNFPHFTYLVVGNRIPCDVFIEWADRDNLVEEIKEKRMKRG